MHTGESMFATSSDASLIKLIAVAIFISVSLIARLFQRVAKKAEGSREESKYERSFEVELDRRLLSERRPAVPASSNRGTMNKPPPVPKKKSLPPLVRTSSADQARAARAIAGLAAKVAEQAAPELPLSMQTIAAVDQRATSRAQLVAGRHRKSGRRRPELCNTKLKQAIIWAELLNEPVSLRHGSFNDLR